MVQMKVMMDTGTMTPWAVKYDRQHSLMVVKASAGETSSREHRRRVRLAWVCSQQ